MIGITLAPELGVAMAMYQYLQAREGLRKLRADREIGSQEVESKGVESKEVESKGIESKDAMVEVLGVGRDEITMSHAFFANMGGFIAKICVIQHPQQDRSSSDKPDEISSVPEMSKEFILNVRNCQHLSQYPILSASDTLPYRLWH